MTLDELQLASFRQIRIKVSDVTDNSSNDEIAGFVKGIICLERELFTIAIRDESQLSVQNDLIKQ